MTETEKIEKVFKAAKYLVHVWRRFGYPVTFDRVIRENGVDVRVIVEDAEIAGRESELDDIVGAVEQCGARHRFIKPCG